MMPITSDTCDYELRSALGTIGNNPSTKIMWPDAETGPYIIDLRTNMVEFGVAFANPNKAVAEHFDAITRFLPVNVLVPNGFGPITEFLAANAISGWTKFSTRAIGDTIRMANRSEAEALLAYDRSVTLL